MGRVARLRMVVMVLTAASLLGSPVVAVEPAAESEIARRAHELSESVMSPYCPGRTLADCPSPEAGRLRAEIRTLLARGEAEAEVRTQLEQRYGDLVQAIPRSPFARLMPIVLLALGLAVLALVLVRMVPSGRDPSPARVPRELERELESDLRSRGL